MAAPLFLCRDISLPTSPKPLKNVALRLRGGACVGSGQRTDCGRVNPLNWRHRPCQKTSVHRRRACIAKSMKWCKSTLKGMIRSICRTWSSSFSRGAWKNASASNLDRAGASLFRAFQSRPTHTKQAPLLTHLSAGWSGKCGIRVQIYGHELSPPGFLTHDPVV